MDDNGATQAINYSYTANTNKLASTTHGTASRTYSYNAIGQMVSMNSTLATDPSQRTIAYTSDGLVKSVTNTVNSTSVTHAYTYDEAGMRIAKTNQTTGVTTYTVRDVNGNELAIYERANNATTLKELNVYGGSHLGKASVDGTVTYSYYLKDHLGNVRAEIARTKKTNGEADLLAWTDFDPTGLELPGRQFTSVSSLAPRGYQGDYATKDQETGLNHFELRDYDPLIARWTAPDPYGQYHSPYVGMGNNWVNQIDEDGGWAKGHGLLWNLAHKSSGGLNKFGMFLSRKGLVWDAVGNLHKDPNTIRGFKLFELDMSRSIGVHVFDNLVVEGSTFPSVNGKFTVPLPGGSPKISILDDKIINEWTDSDQTRHAIELEDKLTRGGFYSEFEYSYKLDQKNNGSDYTFDFVPDKEYIENISVLRDYKGRLRLTFNIRVANVHYKTQFKYNKRKQIIKFSDGTQRNISLKDYLEELKKAGWKIKSFKQKK